MHSFKNLQSQNLKVGFLFQEEALLMSDKNKDAEIIAAKSAKKAMLSTESNTLLGMPIHVEV